MGLLAWRAGAAVEPLLVLAQAVEMRDVRSGGLLVFEIGLIFMLIGELTYQCRRSCRRRALRGEHPCLRRGSRCCSGQYNRRSWRYRCSQVRSDFVRQ